MATWSDVEVTFFIGNDLFLVFLSFLSRSFIVNHVFFYTCTNPLTCLIICS